MNRRTVFIFLISFISIFSLYGCRKAVFNNPESIASYVVESLLSGNYDNLKKYAIDDVSRNLDSATASAIFEKISIFKNMYIENLYVTEQSYDGTIKNVNFVMRNNQRKSIICITMVDDDGQWLYSNIQCT